MSDQQCSVGEAGLRLPRPGEPRISEFLDGRKTQFAELFFELLPGDVCADRIGCPAADHRPLLRLPLDFVSLRREIRDDALAVVRSFG